MLDGSQNFWAGPGVRLAACCGARKRAKPHGGTVLAGKPRCLGSPLGPGTLGEKTPELYPSSTALTSGWVSVGRPCPLLRPGPVGENRLPCLDSVCKGI